MSKDIQNFGAQLVDPARLKSGHWCHRAEKTIGEGDISASYSGDRIGMAQPVRKPFAWQGSLWVCVGVRSCGDDVSAEAYRLTHPQAFKGEPVTYADKVRNGDSSRADPRGFYHGMRVRRGREDFVLAGPPVTFDPGQSEQMSLF